MKKVILLSIFATSILAFPSCKKDDGGSDSTSTAVNCTAKAKAYSDAGVAYANDPSEVNCKAYKAAMEDYKSSSCISGQNQAVKDALQASIDALDC